MIKQFLQGVINQVKVQADLSRDKPLSVDSNVGIAFDPNQGQPDRSGGEDEVLPLSPEDTIASAPISITDSLAHRNKRVMLKKGKRGKDSLLSSMYDKNKRLGMKTGGLFDKIKEAWKARENNILRAEREGNIEDLKASIVEQENTIADRLLEIAEKNEKYSTLSAPRTPSSYVVSDEEHEKRNKSREKSLADEVLGTPGSVSPMVWIFGAIGRRGLKYETMPESEYNRLVNSAGNVAKEVQKEIEMERRNPLQEGGPSIDEQMGALMPEEAPISLETEEEAIETQIPDEEMESDYIDMVVNEALSPEEEQYLLDRLNEDERLSVIFDKVVETASEFSGSGSVEGPGSAVSDSIPARLSDGEFVMTSKATEQIGPDTLEELMSLAEDEADGVRQAIAIGGIAKAEGSAILSGASEDERSIALKNKEAMRLLDPRLSLFAS